MGFDPKQDALQKEETNRRILDAGFCIFSEMSIDKVSMANVANKAGIGIATLYRYYRTKPELVVAVGTHVWSNFIRNYTPIRNDDKITAVEELEFFLDSFLELYKNHKKLLCFNQFFNIYIRNEAVPPKALNSYNEMVDKLAMRFHRTYVKGERDKTLCTEMSEKAMFLSIVHLMLAAVTRYAIGLVYEKDSESYKELILLKNMIMREFSQKNNKV
ncbi:transcriptional regulator, TetR family [Eubacterium nodatum ATCC 33099]|nr:transcriptional regulator, TetR family [Eubacterium nodatum ATCC 33099]